MAKLSFVIVSPGKELRITTLSRLLHASAWTTSIFSRLLAAALILRNSVLLVGDLMMLLCLLLLSDLIAIVI